MNYKSMVNICLSRFLSEYKITEFYNKISSNVGAKEMTSGTILTSVTNYLKTFINENLLSYNGTVSERGAFWCC